VKEPEPLASQAKHDREREDDARDVTLHATGKLSHDPGDSDSLKKQAHRDQARIHSRGRQDNRRSPIQVKGNNTEQQ